MERRVVEPDPIRRHDVVGGKGFPGLRGWLSCLALTLTLALSGTSHGARQVSLYVSDTTVEANLRSGIDADQRIIAMLRPGTQVTLLREERGWAEVTLQDGRRGWILKRYLADRPPWMVTAQQLEGENHKLREQLKGLGGNQQELTQENDRLKKEVEETRKRVEEMERAYRDTKLSGQLRWFLSGAGVVLVGWLLGYWMGRTGRRRSSGLYR
jgi:SH3 domain protein